MPTNTLNGRSFAVLSSVVGFAAAVHASGSLLITPEA